MKVCSSAAGGGWRLLTLHANQRSLIRLFLYAWQTTHTTIYYIYDGRHRGKEELNVHFESTINLSAGTRKLICENE